MMNLNESDFKKKTPYSHISNEMSILIHKEYELSLSGKTNKFSFRTFWGLVKSYLAFEWNNVKYGKLSKEIFLKRAKICKSCPGLMKSPFDSIGFCGLCGCGMNPRARLTVKLTVSGASCPIGKWSPMWGKKFRLINLYDTALGICRTLWYNVSRLWKRN